MLCWKGLEQLQLQLHLVLMLPWAAEARTLLSHTAGAVQVCRMRHACMMNVELGLNRTIVDAVQPTANQLPRNSGMCSDEVSCKADPPAALEK